MSLETPDGATRQQDEAFAFTRINKGVVLATDHFISTRTAYSHPNVQPLLSEIFRPDPPVEGEPEADNPTDRIHALWVPGDGVGNHHFIEQVSAVANGVSTGLPVNKTTGVQRGRPLAVIYDTALAGGVEAAHRRIEHIRVNFPAPEMVFTIASGVDPESIKDLIRLYSNCKNIGFLLSTSLPEQKDSGIERTFTKNEAALTMNTSELADDLDVMGVVGYGALARFTRVGQYFLALGVCIYEANDYVSRLVKIGGDKDNPDDIVEVTKRMVTPEATFLSATRTQVAAGRTLFQRNNSYLFPDSMQMSDDVYGELRTVVRENLRKLARRLDALPEPLPLQM